MKTASPAMQAHLQQDSATLAYLWRIKRVGGIILGFTTHDVDITYDAGDGSPAYKASTGFTASATKNLCMFLI